MPKCHGRYAMGERGFFFPIVLLVLVGLLSLVGVSVTRSLAEVSAARTSVATQQAFYLAEAGVDEALQWLRGQPAPPICPNLAYPCTVTPSNATQTLGGVGNFSVGIELPATNLDASTDLYTIRANATTANASVTRAVAYNVRTESFARFQLFNELDSGWWVTGTGASGPVHTNSRFMMYGTPSFWDPVSSVAPSLYCPYGPCTPSFYGSGSLALGIPRIEMSTATRALTDNALILPGHASISLNGAWMLVTNTAKGWSNTPLPIASTPAIYATGNLVLDGGTLNGQLTLGSNQDIIIKNAVTYACDPLVPSGDPDCKDATGQVRYNDDILGLVAKQNVILSREAPTTLRIDAAVMAINGSYYFEEYDRGSPRGRLFIYGAFIERAKGYFYSMDWNTWRCIYGYCPSLWGYDQRLRNLAPPYYPTTGRYESVLWNEEP